MHEYSFCFPRLSRARQIVFEFDRLRNFTSVRFHCNNLFSKDVRVFRRALLHFGATSRGYQARPVVYDFMRETFIEFARNVIVPVPHRVGRFVRVELYFDAKWMMISEVRFDSGRVKWEGSKNWVRSRMNLHRIASS